MPILPASASFMGVTIDCLNNTVSAIDVVDVEIRSGEEHDLFLL